MSPTCGNNSSSRPNGSVNGQCKACTQYACVGERGCVWCNTQVWKTVRETEQSRSHHLSATTCQIEVRNSCALQCRLVIVAHDQRGLPSHCGHP